jgi:thiol-disulfide isomerase/thioredoxin
LVAAAPLAAHAALPTPQIGAALPPPVAAPYPAPDGAHAAVDAAFARAKASGKKVLIDFGGNWCPDCRLLAGVFREPAVDAWLPENFVVVAVNVGHFEVNTDIAARYNVKIKAVPTVLIITPDGKLLNPDGTLALGNARAMSAQAVVDLIAQWNSRNF